MEINIWSSITLMPQDLLRTKISWLAHDLDKTINAKIDFKRFKQVALNESQKLEESLKEWESRNFLNDELILWAKEVLFDYETILNERKECNTININYSEFSPEMVIKLIKTRRSIRRWEKRPLSRDIILKLIEAGQWAPSACNRQSCRYIVLDDDSQKQLLVNLREEWLTYAPVLIFIGTDKRNYLPIEYDYVPYMDASMAAQNILLMAHALGLGATIIKTSAWDMIDGKSRNYSTKLIDMYEGLNIPSYFIPVAIIAVGYPARIPKEPKRLPIDSIMHYNKCQINKDTQHDLKYQELQISANVNPSNSGNISSISTKKLIKIVIKRIINKF